MKIVEFILIIIVGLLLFGCSDNYDYTFEHTKRLCRGDLYSSMVMDYELANNIERTPHLTGIDICLIDAMDEDCACIQIESGWVLKELKTKAYEDFKEYRESVQL